jgi:hypothetical protein
VVNAEAADVPQLSPMSESKEDNTP